MADRKMIQFKLRILQDTHALIKARAEAAGLSLNSYICRTLEEHANQQTLSNLTRRIEALEVMTIDEALGVTMTERL